MDLEQSSPESWLYNLSITCQYLVTANFLCDWSLIIGLKGLIDKIGRRASIKFNNIDISWTFQVWISSKKILDHSLFWFYRSFSKLLLCTQYDKRSFYNVLAETALSKEVIKRDCLICLVRFSEPSFQEHSRGDREPVT